VRRWLTNDARMQADRDRLVKISCAPSLPVHLKGAPRPTPVADCACP
jgi:hypothetical protein